MTTSFLSAAAATKPATPSTTWNSLKRAFLPVLLLLAGSASAQQIVFSENLGIPTANTTIVAYSTGTAPATFQNKGVFTFSNGAQTNPGDLRVTSVSSGYTGASGGGNVFLTTTSGAYGFSIEGIDASAYTSLSLSYGYRKELAGSHATFAVEYWDGSSWLTLANTAGTLFNEAAGAATGWYLAKSLALPIGGQNSALKIRFVKTGTASIRIDDIKLTGTPAVPTTSSISPSTVSAGGPSFTVTVNGTNFIRTIASSNTVSSITINGTPVTTAFTSSTALTATVSSGSIAAGGSLTIGVSTTSATASNTQTLTISTIPTVVTGVADVTNGSATTVLHGTVNANTADASPSFNFGLTNSYGSNLGATPATVSGTTVTGIVASLSGLDPNVTYHYQASATNAGGTGTGNDATFVSPAATPNAPTVGNAGATTLDVTLAADANPAGTEYAIHETTTNQYVQANGSLGASAVYQTAAAWGTKTVTGLAGATSYTFEAIARNSAGITTAAGASSTASTSAGNSITMNSGTIPAAFCNGAASNFNIAFTTSGSFTGNFYAQLSDASGNFPGDVTSNLISPAAAATPVSATLPQGLAAGNYRIRIVNDNPAFMSADNGFNIVVTAAVTPTVTISANPGTTICDLTSVTFTANPTNGGTPSYAWSKNAAPVGTNSSTYTDAALANGDMIAVVMTSSATCVTTSTANDVVTMTVNAKPATPSAPVAAANPACASTTLLAMTDPGGGISNYWQGTTALGTSTASPATIAFSVSATNTYYVRAQSAAGCWSDASSLLVTIFAAPSITSHPLTQSAYANSGVTLTSSATGSVSQVWQVSTDNGTNFNGLTNVAPYSGTTTTTLAISSFTAAMSGYQYRIAYTGNTPCGAFNSNAATITALPAQAVVFTENIGTPGGTTLIGSYSGWQNNGTYTFTSTGTQSDVRTTTPSTGYANASANGNIFMGIATVNARNFQIAGINTTNYSGLVLTFGMLRDNVVSDLLVEVSTDGTTYTPLTISQPSTANVWTAITASGSIPSTSNLRIRFSKTNGSQIRLDDIRLAGYLATPTTSSLSPNTVVAGASTFNMVVNGTGFVNNATAVTWNGSSAGITTTFNSSIQVTASIPASLVTTTGSFQVGVTVTGAQSSSNTQTFTVTDAPPTITTGIAQESNGSGVVTLLGTVNANNVSTDVTFEYGLTNIYGSSSPALQNPVTGTTNTPVSALVSGLSPNVTYHYRASATSTAGTTNGNDATFVSPAAQPGQPVLDNATASSLDLSIVDGGNPANTEYAIHEMTTNRYVQTNGSLNTSAVWQIAGTGAGQWGNNTSVSGKARVTGLSSNTGYTFEVVARNSVNIETAAGTSASETTTAGNTLTIDNAVPTTVCNGAPTSFNVQFTANGGFTGNFFVQLSDASGNFTNSLSSNIISSGSASSPVTATIPAGTTPGTGYRVRVINDNPEFYGDDNGTNITITAQVATSVSISANPGSTICNATSVTFTATPVNGGTPTYAWTKNGNPVGTNSNTYTDGSLANGDAIQVTMTSSLTCVTASSVPSNTITMVVNTTTAPPTPTAAANPSCGATSLNAISAPGGNLTYYWQGTTSNGTSTTSPATSSFPVSATGTYYLRAFNSVTGCWSAQTSLAVSVTPAVSVSTHPSNGSAFVGGNTSFTAVASNSVSVVWQVNTGSGFVNLTNVAPYSNVTTSTMTITSATLVMSGNQYRAVYTGTAPCTTATSNAATLTVSPTPVTLFSENIGTGTSNGTNLGVNTYTGWQNQGTLSFSGSIISSQQADVRNTTVSTGYTNASGASNVFFGTAGSVNNRNFVIGNINTLNYSNLTLSYGLLRDATTNGMTVEVSTDGTNYTPLTVTQPSTSNVYALITASGSIPATANLRIRFSKNSSTSFRLDDIKLVGTPATPTVSSITPNSIVEGSNAFTLTVNGTGYVSGSTVTWSGSSAGIATTFVNGNQLTASIPSNLVTTAGTFPVGVTTTGAAASSNTQNFTVSPRTITVTSLSGTSFCNGSNNNLTVGFTSTGTYSGSFFVQLSDASGQFPNDNTSNIISAGSVSSPIVATILSGQTPGTYKVRVVNVSPAVYSGGSNNIAIDPSGTASISYSGAPYCTSTGFGTVTRTGTAGGTYSASPAGLVINASTGAIDLAASSDGTYTVTYAYAGGTACASAATATVSLRPATLINNVANQVYCAGVVTSPINFTGAPGITYAWTNTNTATGIAASGTGNIGSFTTTNGGNTTIQSTVTVTPVGGTGCAATKMVFRFDVKPAPVVSAVANQSFCAGNNTNAVTFISNTAGTIFSWTNSNTSIGLVASGTNNIASFVAQNNTGINQLATVSVTPYSGVCGGAPISFTYTITPSAGSISYSAPSYCQAGWAYVSRIGSGGGNYTALPAGLNINAGTGAVNLALSTPGTYTVTYNLAAGVCAGTSTTQITINPQATVNPVGNPVYCNGVVTSPIVFTGTASSYTWTNDNTSIGLGASGTGNIPSFTTVNAGPLSSFATIRVTPVGNGGSTCTGKAASFRLTVKFCPPVTHAGDHEGDGNTGRISTTQVTVSPNPTQGVVTVQLSGKETGSYTLQVLNSFGQPVNKPVLVTGSSYSLDLSGLNPGLYRVQLVNTRTGVTLQKQVIRL
jgi:hypothetical protein